MRLLVGLLQLCKRFKSFIHWSLCFRLLYVVQTLCADSANLQGVEEASLDLGSQLAVGILAHQTPVDQVRATINGQYQN